MTPPARSELIAQSIDRPAAVVYEYAANPDNRPRWAPGLGSGVECVHGQWFVQTGAGRVGFRFAERNAYGVLDHEVALPSGDVLRSPMCVVPNGDGAEVVFHLRRLPDMTDEDFARDAALVAADLARLKQVLEQGE